MHASRVKLLPGINANSKFIPLLVGQRGESLSLIDWIDRGLADWFGSPVAGDEEEHKDGEKFIFVW